MCKLSGWKAVVFIAVWIVLMVFGIVALADIIMEIRIIDALGL